MELLVSELGGGRSHNLSDRFAFAINSSLGENVVILVDVFCLFQLKLLLLKCNNILLPFDKEGVAAVQIFFEVSNQLQLISLEAWGTLMFKLGPDHAFLTQVCRS